jgi:hypothetical protein
MVLLVEKDHCFPVIYYLCRDLLLVDVKKQERTGSDEVFHIKRVAASVAVFEKIIKNREITLKNDALSSGIEKRASGFDACQSR